MIRYGIGALVAAGACAAIGVAACDDSITDFVPPVGAGGATGAGGAVVGNGGASSNGGSTSGGATGGGIPIPATCGTGACCPTDPSCYSDPAKGPNSPGAECLATRDNTGQNHIQMRQALIRALTPLGNTQAIVYGVLAGRTELPDPTCFQGRSASGSGGYIQLIDFYLGGSNKTPGDISNDFSTVGFAQYVTKATLADTLTNGFCYGAELYAGDSRYALTTASITNPNDANYPPGLPKPMGLKDGPWKVGATKAKRIAADFDLSDQTKRKALLAQLDQTTGEYGKLGFDGVFFYDPVTGYAHGFGSLAWTVVYSLDGKSHISIPIREVETKSRFNDPKVPDCVGTFMANALDPGSSPTCGSNDPNAPAWGGGQCTAASGDAPGDHMCDPTKTDDKGNPIPEGPATTDGYFLITELQQIYSPDLQSTLCVSYPTQGVVDKQGFYDATSSGCVTPKWDPTKADGSGIPKGDWCAATNGPATDTCHDAWKSRSIHVYVAGKIKVPAVPTDPIQTCKFDATSG